MIIAIDTNILIYAGMAPSKNEVDEDKRLRAQLLIHRHSQSGDQIVISHISVAEILVQVPAREMGALTQTLTKHFIIAPFESRSSAYAADLIAKAKKKPRQFNGYARTVMIPDAMIIATCRAAGANTFYSNDSNALRLAKLAGLQAYDLPEIHMDGDLFTIEDLKKGKI